MKSIDPTTQPTTPIRLVTRRSTVSDKRKRHQKDKADQEEQGRESTFQRDQNSDQSQEQTDLSHKGKRIDIQI